MRSRGRVGFGHMKPRSLTVEAGKCNFTDSQGLKPDVIHKGGGEGT
jgi:hypothetical protein